MDDAGTFNNYMAWVKKNRKFGFVDTSGTLVTPIKYNAVEDFDYGYAWFESSEGNGFVNRSGKEIICSKNLRLAREKNGGWWNMKLGYQGIELVYEDKRPGYIDIYGRRYWED